MISQSSSPLKPQVSPLRFLLVMEILNWTSHEYESLGSLALDLVQNQTLAKNCISKKQTFLVSQPPYHASGDL